MPDYRIYDVEITTLTPLHIGNGRELLHRYDYVIHDEQTWRINEAALLDAQAADDLATAELLARTPPGDLLTDEDFRTDAPWFRYVIAGAPRSRVEGAQLREQIKDPYDQIYLPGSSLKGALRTVLGWYVWGLRKYTADPALLGPTKKGAARDIERELFGQTPNLDWLRALHVADSAPLPPSRLTVLNASVLRRNGQAAAPIKLEAVPQGVQFHTTLKVDLALYSEWAARLKLQHQGLLLNLPAVVQRYTREQLSLAYAWAEKIENGELLRAHYARLAGAELPAHRCLLQVGWGTGWQSKTFGTRLLRNAPLKKAMFRKYQLRRGRTREAPDDFPSTRRVVVDVIRHRSSRTVTPRSPFGWLLLDIQERTG